MMYSTSLTGMFTGSYSSNSKVGLLWHQLRTFLCCDDLSALLKTARSLLFRRETKVRAKCMCTSDGRVSSQPRSENQHMSEKGHVMRLVSSESRE